MCACKAGKAEVVEHLLQHGADPDMLDKFDVSAVHLAAENGHVAALKSLLEAGAHCNGTTKFSRKGWYTACPFPGGTTALHLAALNDNPGERRMRYGVSKGVVRRSQGTCRA